MPLSTLKHSNILSSFIKRTLALTLQEVSGVRRNSPGGRSFRKPPPPLLWSD